MSGYTLLKTKLKVCVFQIAITWFRSMIGFPSSFTILASIFSKLFSHYMLLCSLYIIYLCVSSAWLLVYITIPWSEHTKDFPILIHISFFNLWVWRHQIKVQFYTFSWNSTPTSDFLNLQIVRLDIYKHNHLPFLLTSFP